MTKKITETEIVKKVDTFLQLGFNDMIDEGDVKQSIQDFYFWCRNGNSLRGSWNHLLVLTRTNNGKSLVKRID